MTKQYQGAYSRRRFSNMTVGVEGTADVNVDNNAIKKFPVSINWDASKGCVDAAGISYNTNNGNPSAGQLSVVSGDSVTIEATPNEGYHFVRWQGGPIDGKTSPKVSFAVNSPVVIRAIFKKDDQGSGGNGGNGGNGGQPAYALNPDDLTITQKAWGFVKQYWWAILIVAFIAYKYWKGAKQ